MLPHTVQLKSALALSVALALLLVVSVTSSGDSAASSSFSPTGTLHFSDTTPGVNPDVITAFNLAAPDPNFSAVVAFTPTELAIPKDADIPDGALVGSLNSTATLGLLSNACSTSIRVHFDFEDATTDTTNTIDPLPPGAPDPLAALAGDTSNPRTGKSTEPPPGVTKYPSYLNTLFPGLKPRARYAAASWLPSATTWVILQLVIFDPGTQVDTALPPPDPALGYESVTVLQDPTAPAAPSPITDFCTPLLATTTLYGKTKDNLATPADEGGITLITNPTTAGALNFATYSRSQLDADGDGIENALDPCPFNKDTVWDPRAAITQGDTNDFAGSPLADGIPDGCDALHTEPTSGQPSDRDGDGFLNRGDNCPQVYNPDQLDTDKDGIGDACDTPGMDAGTDCIRVGCVPGAGNPLPPREVAGNGPTVPDGNFFTCWKVATLQIGGSPDALVSDCSDSPPAAGAPAAPAATGGTDTRPTPTVNPVTGIRPTNVPLAAGSGSGGVGSGPAGGIGSLAPIATSVPFWAAMLAVFGALGLACGLGLMSARLRKRR